MTSCKIIKESGVDLLNFGFSQTESLILKGSHGDSKRGIHGNTHSECEAASRLEAPAARLHF